MPRPQTRKLPCKIQYRVCKIDGGSHRLTLQDLIHTALSKTGEAHRLSDNWIERRQDTSGDPDVPEFLFFNHLRGHKQNSPAGQFGDLCQYHPGTQQVVIEERDGAPELQVSMIPPQERHQFLSGMLYWRVVGNHVFVIQGRTVRWRLLENHLRWLLSEKTGVLPLDVSLSLSADIPVPAARRDRSRVSSLRLKAEVPNPNAMLQSTRPAPQRGGAILPKIAATGANLIRALRELVHDDGQLERILAKIPEDEEIGIELNLKFPKVDKAPMAITLGDLDGLLDYMDDADVSVDTDAGSFKLGEILQPRFDCRVFSTGGVWDREDVLTAFQEAYTHFRGKGFIT